MSAGIQPRSFDRDITIYIVTKNCVYFPSGNHFQPIQGGRSLAQSLPQTIGDDTGQNISSLNEYYAEISSMYWVWKNAPRSEYVGFFHYRRFLNFAAPLNPEAPWENRNWYDFSPESIERFGWSKQVILDQISGYDIILPYKENIMRPPEWNIPGSMYTHYRNTQISRDINLALDVISDSLPEYKSLSENVLSSQTGYFCQLIVCRWEVFTAYMEWLFVVLDGCKKRIDLKSPLYAPNTGQTRVFGFLAERLINIYVEKKRQEGASIKEFERLFAKFGNDHSVKLVSKNPTKNPRIGRFHGGHSINALGWKIEVKRPD